MTTIEGLPPQRLRPVEQITSQSLAGMYQPLEALGAEPSPTCTRSRRPSTAARPAVRVLHARHGHGAEELPRGTTRTRPATTSGTAIAGNLCRCTGIPAHHRCRNGCRRSDARMCRAVHGLGERSRRPRPVPSRPCGSGRDRTRRRPRRLGRPRAELAASLAGQGYVADRPWRWCCTWLSELRCPGPARRRAGRGEDRPWLRRWPPHPGPGWSGCSATKGWPHSMRSTSGTTPGSYSRSGWPRRSGTAADDFESRASSDTRVPAASPTARRHLADRRPAGAAARRRGGPGRRGVRGAAARAAVAVPDHHPGDRHDHARHGGRPSC